MKKTLKLAVGLIGWIGLAVLTMNTISAPSKLKNVIAVMSQCAPGGFVFGVFGDGRVETYPLEYDPPAEIADQLESLPEDNITVVRAPCFAMSAQNEQESTDPISYSGKYDAR